VKELRDSGERVRGDEGILGTFEFVDRVLRESQEDWERRAELRKRGLDLKWLVEKVAWHFGVDSESLGSGRKVSNVAEARCSVLRRGAWDGINRGLNCEGYRNQPIGGK